MTSGRSRTLCAGVLALVGVFITGARDGCAQESTPPAQTPGSVSSIKPDAKPDTAQPVIHGNFFERLGRFYLADWRGKLPVGPTPQRRAFDSPLDSPPYPSGDWSYGGSPTIGVPDTSVYPLMTALRHENSRNKIYGWAKGTYN